MKLSTMTDADLSQLFAQAAIELNNRKRLGKMAAAMIHPANLEFREFRRAMWTIKDVVANHREVERT